MLKMFCREGFGGGGNSGLLNYFSSETLNNVSKNVLNKDYTNFRDFSGSALRYCFGREGFTLAEVLITLGVLGVVAALTMPSLIANYREKALKTQLKKSLSVVNQAIRAGMAKEEITETSDIGGCFRNGNNNSSFNSLSLCAFLVQNAKVDPPKSYNYYEMISNYQGFYNRYGANASNQLVQNVINSSNSAVAYVGNYMRCGLVAFQLDDGAIVGIMGLNAASLSDCRLGQGQMLTDTFIRANYLNCGGVIDVNGVKGPNKFATCNNNIQINLTPSEPCEVGDGNVGDIYPIIFHDGIFEMATNAGAYVLSD